MNASGSVESNAAKGSYSRSSIVHPGQVIMVKEDLFLVYAEVDTPV